jgi:hypothetical protein
MSAFTVGTACVQRVDHGEGKPITFDEAIALVEHPLTGLNRQQLVEVIAYLACQVVGYAHSQNADAKLAISQVERIVDEFRHRRDRQVAS